MKKMQNTKFKINKFLIVLLILLSLIALMAHVAHHNIIKEHCVICSFAYVLTIFSIGLILFILEFIALLYRAKNKKTTVLLSIINVSRAPPAHSFIF